MTKHEKEIIYRQLYEEKVSEWKMDIIFLHCLLFPLLGYTQLFWDHWQLVKALVFSFFTSVSYSY